MTATSELLLEPAPAAAEPAPAAAQMVTRIGPPRGWQFIDVGELWRYRELLFFLVWRDVKIRYRQTVLGVAWAVLQPLLMMVVFTIFFGRMAGLSSGDIPYPLFALAGLLPWTFFSTALSQAGNSVVGSERLVTKIYFPRLCIPFAVVGAAGVDFLIAGGLLLVFMGYNHVWPTWNMLAAPLAVFVIALAGMGFGTLLAALNVRYRDVRYLVPFLVQFWMFATPSVYMQPKTDGSGALHLLLQANPMTGLISTFRAACLGTPIPWGQFGVASAFVLVVFVVGCLYFRRSEDAFADII
jgi:lipopolysaccharide transport system permease protein